MRSPEFWTGRSPAARIAATALSPLGYLYGATVAIKGAQANPYRSSAKVICVGNLTTGGTGKTPVVRAIAERLIAKGLRVFLLSRGYGGRLTGPVLVDPTQHSAAEVGDEPLMLAATAPAIVARHRAEGARLAENHQADVILMDDGHQNFSLAKDLSLVVIDSAEGFGNGRVLPAGPLREPVKQGLARADGVILMGPHNFSLPHFGSSVLRARIVPQHEGQFAGLRVVAFAGIGQPQKFFATLNAAGAEVIEAFPFADHHRYREHEIHAMRDKALLANATLVTTEKDYVRLPTALRNDINLLRVSAMFDDLAELTRLLDSIVQAPAVPALS
ncbi:MAG TPA: tetraacyldisaccharide 4'-kinase [Rhizomicrobium sp.]|nr:tetraacyldisaccharide 4'-kinase [Rhizomicrobium sp.]